MVMVLAQTEELRVNCDASYKLRVLPLHRQTPTGHLIPTAPEVDICTAEGRTDTAGCTRLRRRPVAASSAEATDMATMAVVVDTVGTLRGVTEAP